MLNLRVGISKLIQPSYLNKRYQVLWVRNLFFFLLLLFSFQVHAKQQKQMGFVADQINTLETKVRKNHDIKDIAHYLSQLRVFLEWPKNMDPDLKLYVAIKWFDQKNFKESNQLFDTINPLKTNQALFSYYRAMVLIHSSNAQKAMPLIAKLEGLYPKDFNVQFLKSLYLAEINDISGAIEVLDALTKRHSRNGKVYLQRGVYHLVSLSNDKAIEDFKKALKYLFKHDIYNRQQVYLQLGLIYWKIKLNRKKGRFYIKKGVELDPNSELVRQTAKALKQRM